MINHIDYDSFGNILAQTNPAAGDRFTYTGREFDAETGLYYYRARYYDPNTGRFISEDPLSFAAGDANLYRYVGNGPLNYVDPWGMTPISYATLVNYSIRTANAVTGLTLGYVCGWLEGWYRNDPDPHQQALIEAGIGFAFGLALGVTPQKFQIFVGIAGAVGAVATSDDFVIAGIRGTCIAVQFGISKGLGKLGNKLLNSPLSKAGQVPDRNGLTKAGRALQKHGDRAGSKFPKSTGNAAARNEQGQQVLDGILSSPNRTTKANRYGGQDIWDGITGRGARYDGAGNFMGFLD